MPLTDDGRQRLAVELEHADEALDPPRLVWLFLPEHLPHTLEVRATVYARRGVEVLCVWHLAPLHDCVEWRAELDTRLRRE